MTQKTLEQGAKKLMENGRYGLFDSSEDKALACQIFTGDDLFPFEIGDEINTPRDGKAIVKSGSTMHENNIMGEYYLIRVSSIDKDGNYSEDEEVFCFIDGKFYI